MLSSAAFHLDFLYRFRFQFHSAKSINFERKSIQEMEKELGLDKVKPITVTPSVVEDFAEDENYWKDLYEETLAEIYE